MRHGMPAAAAYAAAAEPALPALGSAMPMRRNATAPFTAMTSPRALNDCVGLPLSSAGQSSATSETLGETRERQQRRAAFSESHDREVRRERQHGAVAPEISAEAAEQIARRLLRDAREVVARDERTAARGTDAARLREVGCRRRQDSRARGRAVERRKWVIAAAG